MRAVDPAIYRDFYSLVYYLMLPICIHLYLFRFHLHLFVQLVNPSRSITSHVVQEG